MSGHTPGPWRRSGDRVIQTKHLTRDVWEIPRVEADLDLIAAAPELLEALEAEVAHFDQRLAEYRSVGDDSIAEVAVRHHGPRIERARAAIAKARGGR